MCVANAGENEEWSVALGGGGGGVPGIKSFNIAYLNAF